MNQIPVTLFMHIEKDFFLMAAVEVMRLGTVMCVVVRNAEELLR
jgi:hypothetical protein